MELKNRITATIRQYLIEEEISSDNIKNILIERIPFLSVYEIFEHPRDKNRLQAQRRVQNENVKMMMGDTILTFPQYNILSEIIYYPHRVYENTFHNFIIKNQFFPLQPKEMDDLTYHVFIEALKLMREKLSYSNEIMVKDGEEIPKKVLDKIINDMNGILFKVEEFTEKYSIDLF